MSEITPVTESQAFQRARQGLTFEQMLDAWQTEVEAPLRGLTREERIYRFYSRYNWDRMKRVESLYSVDEGFSAILARDSGPQTWLFITENWCADAAYALPVVRQAAETRGDVDLRFLMRDDNLDVMERYLSGKARSIPVLAVFDSSGKELLRWGSKPAALAKHREDLKAGGADGQELSAASVAWYEANGWLEIERELCDAFAALELVG